MKRWNAETDADGRLSFKYPIPGAGQYRITFKTRDSWQEEVQGNAVFWVSGPKFDGRVYRFNDLEIIADKRTYKIGETAHLLINVAENNSRVLFSDNVSVQAGEGSEGHTVTIAGPPAVSFSTDLFKSPDYTSLYELWEKVAAAAKGPTTVIEGERETAVTSLNDLHRVVLEHAKAGASFQRYKGLGEMNAEELADTTMNAETRTLLKVTMEDAVGADEMFTVLMGDAVEPRREFIEKYALDVANLDI